MSKSTTVKEISPQALAAEFGRRRNNKSRDKKVHAKSWVFRKLTQADRATLEAGGTVVVEGTNAGKVTVSLKKAS